jgi:hypothetical protein
MGASRLSFVLYVSRGKVVPSVKCRHGNRGWLVRGIAVVWDWWFTASAGSAISGAAAASAVPDVVAEVGDGDEGTAAACWCCCSMWMGRFRSAWCWSCCCCVLPVLLPGGLPGVLLDSHRRADGRRYGNCCGKGALGIMKRQESKAFNKEEEEEDE